MKNLLFILIASLALTACEKSPLQKDIDEYCKCAEQLSTMDLYDHDHKGKHVQEKADMLQARIDSLMKVPGMDHDLSDTKRWADCASKISEGSYQRLKEIDTK